MEGPQQIIDRSGQPIPARHSEVLQMNILAIDIGGTNVKFLATGQKESRRFPSGLTMNPEKMVAGVKELTRD